MQDGKYAVVTDRWQKFSDVYVDEKTLDYLATYADEFLVHGVDVEGKRLVSTFYHQPIFYTTIPSLKKSL